MSLCWHDTRCLYRRERRLKGCVRSSGHPNADLCQNNSLLVAYKWHLSVSDLDSHWVQLAGSTPTSSIPVAQIREPPHIAETDSEPYTGQHEVHLPAPVAALFRLLATTEDGWKSGEIVIVSVSEWESKWVWDDVLRGTGEGCNYDVVSW